MVLFLVFIAILGTVTGAFGRTTPGNNVRAVQSCSCNEVMLTCTRGHVYILYASYTVDGLCTVKTHVSPRPAIRDIKTLLDCSGKMTCNATICPNVPCTCLNVHFLCGALVYTNETTSSTRTKSTTAKPPPITKAVTMKFVKALTVSESMGLSQDQHGTGEVNVMTLSNKVHRPSRTDVFATRPRTRIAVDQTEVSEIATRHSSHQGDLPSGNSAEDRQRLVIKVAAPILAVVFNVSGVACICWVYRRQRRSTCTSTHTTVNILDPQEAEYENVPISLSIIAADRTDLDYQSLTSVRGSETYTSLSVPVGDGTGPSISTIPS